MLRIEKSFLLDTTFEEIQEEVKNGYIRKASHPKYPNLEIYNYTDACTFDEHWNNVTRMCRGLVVDTKTKEVIIYCIPKFFNQGESHADIVDFETANITLKEDGYMIQYTYHEDYGLIVTSRGSFDSQYSNYVYDLLKDKVTERTVWSGERVSYMLELCKDFPGDEGIIVTRHPKEKLVCWAATGVMGDEIDLRSIAHTLPDCIEIVKSFTPDEAKKYLTEEVEGVVARGKEKVFGLRTYYPRVKIKTDWFLQMHRLISNCTKKHVFELVQDEIPVRSLTGIPDEFMEQMLAWEDEILTHAENMYQQALDDAETYEIWSDKDLGLKQPLSPIRMKLLWMIRKDNSQRALDYIISYIGKNLDENDCD